MRNLTLLLVLISGLLAGYLIGDYRGKDAREALKKAIETGKTLDTERETAIARLKTELDGINEKHHRELETIRRDSEHKAAAWRRSKDGLSDEIKRSNSKLADTGNRLKSLATQRDTVTETEKPGLELEIRRLQKVQDDLRKEIEGSACLKARVPHSVFDALNEANTGEK